MEATFFTNALRKQQLYRQEVMLECRSGAFRLNLGLSTDCNDSFTVEFRNEAQRKQD